MISNVTSSTATGGTSASASAKTDSATDPAAAQDRFLKLLVAQLNNQDPMNPLDNNTVDLDRERANFVDNTVRYEATLRFINGNAKTMLSAIQGQ